MLDSAAPKIEVARLQIGLDLPLAVQQPLQIDRPQRGRRIVARQLQPLPGADLVLQLEQVELIALHLSDQPLADEKVAHARRRNGNDAGHAEMGSEVRAVQNDRSQLSATDNR